jgi:excisionase family DNA binding protein
MTTKSTLTVPEAADLMNVHPNTVFKLIESGAIPAAKIGRAYVILTKDAMAYIEQLIVQQTNRRLGGLPVRRKGITTASARGLNLSGLRSA